MLDLKCLNLHNTSGVALHLQIFYVGSVFSKTTKWAVGSYIKIPVFGPNVGKDIGNDA